MRNIKILLISSFLLISCSGLKEAGSVLRNDKIKTTDEFLVKKKDPLILPPDFDKIPEPGSQVEKKENEEEKIKKILKAPSTKKSTNNKSSTVEESILKEIRK